MITPTSVELTPVTEPGLTTSRVQADAPETVDMVLLPERISPPSPAENTQEIDSDTEKGDFSELEH